uniref:Uncharacterized protein n=1 Tax=Salmonella enterica subsp. indica TaxID=59207 RepID=I3W3V8_SALER|nr:hypothetical protein [Salmonella enterica subsp. indica]
MSRTKNHSGCGQHSYWSVRISISSNRRRNKMVSNLLQKGIVINSRTIFNNTALFIHFGIRPPCHWFVDATILWKVRCRTAAKKNFSPVPAERWFLQIPG